MEGSSVCVHGGGGGGENQTPFFVIMVQALLATEPLLPLPTQKCQVKFSE